MSNFGFPSSPPYQNYPVSASVPQQQFQSYHGPGPHSPQQQFQSYHGPGPHPPQQQFENPQSPGFQPTQQQNFQNFSGSTAYTSPQRQFFNLPSQGMGDYQNQGAGGYPPQVSPGYPPQQQPQVTPGYPPQQQPQVTPGYPPQQQPQVTPGYPPQQQPQVTPGYPPQQQPQITPGYQNQIIGGVCPTAPDLNGIQPVPGYEGLTFEQTILVPPTVPEWRPDDNDRKPIQNLPNFSEEEVRDAVVQFSSEHCCYGSAPARDMQMREIQMISAFHYKLETFTEKRESSWKFEPYNGQPIDGPQNGPAPSPWEVMALPKNYFVDSQIKLEVPHTAFTRPCHTCVGNGRIRCETCFGNGRKQCTWCKGRGRVTRFDKEENCTTCNATGFERCFKCTGTGQVKCKTCDARGTLKGFVELVITWVNHIDDYVSEVAFMPKDLLRDVTGQTAYEEENPRVFPIVQGAEEAVCRASSDLIAKHSSSFTNERILKQRQTLRILPVSQVKFEWKNKIDTFAVYGFEHRVYFKEYPQKCCCVIS